MKPIAACLVMVVACGGGAGGGDGSSETPDMMSAALVELITVDNTFGAGPPPFTGYFILDRIDPSAGDSTGSSQSTRPLTEEERAAIESAISEYGPVTWIDDPNDAGTEEVVPDALAAFLGVGEPVIEDDTAFVPVSMICGNLCGTWLTYRLERADNLWAVAGIEGPVTIS